MRFFNQFTFQTPESVELEFTLAGIGNRALALVLDYLVLGLILIFLLVSYGLLAFLVSGYLTEIVSRQLSNWVLAIEFLIIFATYVGYFVFFETIWQGQTPGKRRVKIRVIRDDGRKVGLPQATLRALLRPIDDLLFIGVFLIIFGQREKRLGDWVAGTLVIQEGQALASATFLMTGEALALADKLKGEADISRLLPENFAAIREYLKRREGMLPAARKELGRKLAYQVKDTIGWEEVPEGITANLFLEAAYIAYQQQFPTAS